MGCEVEDRASGPVFGLDRLRRSVLVTFEVPSLGAVMKMIAEYLEHALHFEKMAAEAVDPELKDLFNKQASAYRNLAAERAERQSFPTWSLRDSKMT